MRNAPGGGSNSRASNCSRVVLPAPTRPMMANISPRSMRSRTSSKAKGRSGA